MRLYEINCFTLCSFLYRNLPSIHCLLPPVSQRRGTPGTPGTPDRSPSLSYWCLCSSLAGKIKPRPSKPQKQQQKPSTQQVLVVSFVVQISRKINHGASSGGCCCCSSPKHETRSSVSSPRSPAGGWWLVVSFSAQERWAMNDGNHSFCREMVSLAPLSGDLRDRRAVLGQKPSHGLRWT